MRNNFLIIGLLLLLFGCDGNKPAPTDTPKENNEQPVTVTEAIQKIEGHLLAQAPRE